MGAGTLEQELELFQVSLRHGFRSDYHELLGRLSDRIPAALGEVVSDAAHRHVDQLAGFGHQLAQSCVRARNNFLTYQAVGDCLAANSTVDDLARCLTGSSGPLFDSGYCLFCGAPAGSRHVNCFAHPDG